MTFVNFVNLFGQQIDSILLDFSKAFDKVNHHKICAKLHHYGIRGYCLNWIQSFRNKSYSMGTLHKKQMCCQRCPKERCWAHFPFWFIYINDMPAFVKSKLRLFADDAYLYKVIKSNCRLPAASNRSWQPTSMGETVGYWVSP